MFFRTVQYGPISIKLSTNHPRFKGIQVEIEGQVLYKVDNYKNAEIR
jgi:hypothetical protein